MGEPLRNGLIGPILLETFEYPSDSNVGTALDEVGNFNNDLENNIEERHARQKQEMFLWMNTVTVSFRSSSKGHDKLAVIKEETNIEDLIKDEKAEDVELNMIVDEVVLVGNGLAGALQFCMKCSTEAFVTKQASDANASGLSVVEKEHPRSLTPMLWAKKVAMIFPVPLRNYFTFGNVCLVQIYSNLPYSETCYSAFLCQVEHFSEHQTKRPCWEQCLRHLQRDRRTEPAVDLTVWSRFRALTDSNDRARYQRHMTCGENFSDQRYLPMHMLSHEIAEPEPMYRQGREEEEASKTWRRGATPNGRKGGKSSVGGSIRNSRSEARREEGGATWAPTTQLPRTAATGGNVPPCLFGWGLPGRAKLG
uniref:Uncharacterized protein n=1 Tax=Oryza barthii TaxID=65489 RepID=A0A0D3G0F3_9ORYZ